MSTRLIQLVVLCLVLASCRSGSIETADIDNSEPELATRAATAEPSEPPPTVIVAAAPEPTEAPADEEPTPGIGFTITEVEPTPTQPPVPTPAPTPIPPALPQLQAVFPTDDWCATATKMTTNEQRVQGAVLDAPLFQEQFETSQAVLGHAVRVAPPEIAEDVQTLADATDALAAIYAAVDWQTLDADLGRTQQVSFTALAADYNIDRYNRDVCGIANGFNPDDHPSLGPTPDVETLAGVTLRDRATGMLIAQGHTSAEADCLVRPDGVTSPRVANDTERMRQLYDLCGMSPERIAEIFG